MLNHWMEVHGLSVEPPEFEWKILDKYKDPLRRQLCKGLHIWQSGTLNKKSEFNNNLICRLEVVDKGFLTDKQLKLEIESRREYKEKLREFVNDSWLTLLSASVTKECFSTRIPKRFYQEPNTSVPLVKK